MTESRVGILVLAAGASSRMGSPKQLLDIGGQPMLMHVLDQLYNIKESITCVVLGAHYASIQPMISDQYHVVVNEEWEQGMASSIRCGMHYLTYTFPDLQAVILSVADQPLLNASIIDRMIQEYQTSGCKIIQSKYHKTMGPPTLFDRILFADLIKLEGDGGAKSVIARYDQPIGYVSFFDGQYDLDTHEDYVSYLQNHQSL